MRSERGGPEYTEHVDMSAGTSHKTCRVSGVAWQSLECCQPGRSGGSAGSSASHRSHYAGGDEGNIHFILRFNSPEFGN